MPRTESGVSLNVSASVVRLVSSWWVSISVMVEESSVRCGSALNVPLSPLASTSSHSGWPREEVASAAACMSSPTSQWPVW